MKRAILLLLSAFSLTASAQEIELKGARLGMTKAETVAMFPYLSCIEVACYYESRPKAGKLPPDSPLMTLAGAIVSEWAFYFDKSGIMYRQTIHMGASAITPLIAGISSKYGDPVSRESGTLQTVGGAKVEQVTVIWQVGDSQLKAVSPSEKLGRMVVRLSSIKHDQAELERLKAKAKTDL